MPSYTGVPPLVCPLNLGALGLLLRKAFADGALTADEFGGATANIWKSVFAGVGPVGGSLIRYWRSLEPREQAAFQQGMQDPRLAASLTVWFYPDWPGDEEKSWFDLSISLICSAMPWHFQGPSVEKTLVEVNRIKRRLLPRSQVTLTCQSLMSHFLIKGVSISGHRCSE